MLIYQIVQQKMVRPVTRCAPYLTTLLIVLYRLEQAIDECGVMHHTFRVEQLLTYINCKQVAFMVRISRETLSYMLLTVSFTVIKYIVGLLH